MGWDAKTRNGLGGWRWGVEVRVLVCVHALKK